VSIDCVIGLIHGEFTPPTIGREAGFADQYINANFFFEQWNDSRVGASHVSALAEEEGWTHEGRDRIYDPTQDPDYVRNIGDRPLDQVAGAVTEMEIVTRGSTGSYYQWREGTWHNYTPPPAEGEVAPDPENEASFINRPPDILEHDDEHEPPDPGMVWTWDNALTAWAQIPMRTPYVIMEGQLHPSNPGNHIMVRVGMLTAFDADIGREPVVGEVVFDGHQHFRRSTHHAWDIFTFQSNPRMTGEEMDEAAGMANEIARDIEQDQAQWELEEALDDDENEGTTNY